MRGVFPSCRPMGAFNVRASFVAIHLVFQAFWNQNEACYWRRDKVQTEELRVGIAHSLACHLGIADKF